VADIVVGDQLHENFQRWLSPPDPSKNHNIARMANHEGRAEWFVYGNTFSKWKWKTGLLLWIHGKRASPPFPHFIPVFLMWYGLYSWVWKERYFVRDIPYPHYGFLTL
jgi:hypothetical protein